VGAKTLTTIGDEVSTPFGLATRAAGFLVTVRVVTFIHTAKLTASIDFGGGPPIMLGAVPILGALGLPVS